MTADDRVRALEDEVHELRQRLSDEQGYASQWREVAEQRRVQLERLRQHPAVAILFGVARVVLPPVRRVRQRVRRVERIARRAIGGMRHLPAQLTAPRRQRRLERAAAGLPASPRSAVTVSVIVLTRDGRTHLERLLPRLRATVPASTEVIVVDNASSSDTADWLARRDDVIVVRNDTNLSFSEANGRGVAVATGEVLCFLNDDVAPVTSDWLDRLVVALDDDVVAAGAQLVYPRQPWGRARTREVSVQHLGIGFRARPGQVPGAFNLAQGTEPRVGVPPHDVAGVTAACLVVRADDFEEIGGFDPRYHYGAEDVDLCWRLRTGGRRIVVVPDAVLYHHEGATRHREDPEVLRDRQQQNWELFEQRFGPALSRTVRLERLGGGGVHCTDPFRVAITVTRDEQEAGYGDWYTAHELGDELAHLGWDVRYVQRYQDDWYELDDDLDAVIVLLDVFDVGRVARPGLTTIAWIRNWTDRWTTHPWFDEYDVVLASSRISADIVSRHSRQRPHVFPLATAAERFLPGSEPRSGAVLTANNWGTDRSLDEIAAAVPELRVYGRGWEDEVSIGDRWEGHLPYEQLPSVYRSATLVIDQAAGHTRPFGSVNSRVFDALAAGALPVTNQVAGAAELFGDRLPTYEHGDDLAVIARRWLDAPGEAAARARELREIVVAEHTYAERARRLRGLLVERAQRPSIVLATSAPDRQVAPTWGDWHLALALGRELRASGHEVETVTADGWSDRSLRRHDVFVHLKGRSRAPRAEGQLHVLWVISHPDEVTPEECDAADLVMVASHTGFDRELAGRTSTPVEPLLQATDERRFYPRPEDPGLAAPVAFVGNSRFVFRPALRDALASGVDVALYGANWEKFVDPRIVRATHVPNDELPALYSSVEVLLNDHWEDMREHGFASNRLFDALACGTVVVSDAMPGLDELFAGGVITYEGAAELRDVIGGLDADGRRRLAEAGRRAVLDGHTFRHRADELLDAVERHRTATVGTSPRRGGASAGAASS